MNKDAKKFMREPWYWVKMTDRQREALRLACLSVPVKERVEKMGVDRRVVYYHLAAAIKKINEAEGLRLTTYNLVQQFNFKLIDQMRG
jgi:predicted DNA-binding protein (UPF0251 family)